MSDPTQPVDHHHAQPPPLGAPEQAVEACCSVLELRQYTLYRGERNRLIELFEREFVESQEAAGMRLVGQFRDIDNPDRFVWIRGFEDMKSRANALEAFYGGSVWKAHRDAANATMIDSSNVLLLCPASPGSAFPPSTYKRPPAGAGERASSVVVATIYYPTIAGDEFTGFFERHVKPVMLQTGVRPLAYFRSEHAENTFPALPVRTGEDVFVWFSLFESQAQQRNHVKRLEESKKWNEYVLPEFLLRLRLPQEELRLEPTARSQLR